ncbi:MAG: helix-turn-helix domain-containing protein [Oscillospiraceae bacterium]|nr:helix-turn-helix domain-containing protein [Oscillospiraceae bacterium]
MLTAIGRYLRKLRIDRGELLKDMSDRLGVTASYLSAVENGKRAFPTEWAKKIGDDYELDSSGRAELENAVTESADSVKIELSAVNGSRKNLAFAFARKFETLDEAELAKIRKILEDKE